MKFGYTILYVEDLMKTVEFYERAFGINRAEIHDGQYAEMITGATKLAFAPRVSAAKLVGVPFQATGIERDPPPVEIGFVTDDVQAAFDKAIGAGAVRVKGPEKKPWGQVVAYVRDNNGFLVEICTPMS
jgi:lactoylglutathione lyase